MRHIILPIAVFLAFTLLSVTEDKVKNRARGVYINILYKQDRVSRLPSYAHYRFPRKVLKR